MSHFTDTLAEIAGRNAFQLTSAADCASPDNSESAGAAFLLSVRDSALECVSNFDDFDDADDFERLTQDEAHALADAVVPVYTYPKWQTFVDLGAWQEDVSELGYDTSDMDTASNVALYMIAERLAGALFAELQEAVAEDDAEGEDDSED